MITAIQTEKKKLKPWENGCSYYSHFPFLTGAEGVNEKGEKAPEAVGLGATDIVAQNSDAAAGVPTATTCPVCRKAQLLDLDRLQVSV